MTAEDFELSLTDDWRSYAIFVWETSRLGKNQGYKICLFCEIYALLSYIWFAANFSVDGLIFSWLNKDKTVFIFCKLNFSWPSGVASTYRVEVIQQTGIVIYRANNAPGNCLGPRNFLRSTIKKLKPLRILQYCCIWDDFETLETYSR